MRVLITGIAGFIGSHLAERLTGQGHHVFGVDNLETGRIENWPKASYFDICDRASLYQYANLVEPELVIHCAASYKDPRKWHRDVDTNVTGTINAVLVAKHHGAKLVYFQTSLPPVSSYAISKIAGQHYIEQSGLDYLVFRLANIYGPRNLSGPIPTFYKRLKAGQPCTVVETERDMLYIGDLVRCVSHALKNDARGTFDVCSGTKTTIPELYQAVAANFPGAPEATVVAPSVDDVMTELELWRCLPGWSAKGDLEDGVRAAVEWYEQNGVAETFTHLALKG